MVLLASYSAFGGGGIGSMLSSWDAAGIFTYLLPFLLIFAIVYAVLTNIDVFKGNKAVNAVIALAVSLLALQFQIVPIFFSEIFPRMGVALSVMLVIIILGGLFIDPRNPQNKWIKWVIGIITAIILIVVIGGSLRGFGFGGGLGFVYGIPWGTVLLVIIVIGLIAAVVFGSNNKNNP